MNRILLSVAAVAAMAAAANAQTVETWSVVNEDGTLKAEYVPNSDPTAMSVVSFSTPNLDGIQTSGPVAGYIDGSSVPLEANVDNTWQGLKTEPNIEPHDGISVFYAIPGKGNPVNLNKITWEEITTDGEGTGVFRANWNDSYYVPDGSAGLPQNGTYIKFTPKAAGELKVAVWVNKGRREVFVVKDSDAKALPLVTDVKISGYINGVRNEAPEGETAVLTYHDNIVTEADAKLAADPNAEVTEQDAWSIAGTQNQAAWVYLTFNVNANETYWVFNKSSQIGFGGYWFTVGGNDALESIGSDVNAPVEYYNMQGIRVNNPDNGLYIKVQGNKATKVIF